jgi:hypothetical protein
MAVFRAKNVPRNLITLLCAPQCAPGGPHPLAARARFSINLT